MIKIINVYKHPQNNKLIEKLLLFLNIFQYNPINLFLCDIPTFKEKTILEIIYFKKCVNNLQIIYNLTQDYNDILILNDIIIINDKFNNFLNNLY